MIKNLRIIKYSAENRSSEIAKLVESMNTYSLHGYAVVRTILLLLITIFWYIFCDNLAPLICNILGITA